MQYFRPSYWRSGCFAVVNSPPKGVGKLVLGDGSDDPLWDCLEAVLGQQEASQLRLHIPKEKKVRWVYIRWIVRGADRLYAFAALWSPGVSWGCGFGHCPCAEINPGMRKRTFGWDLARALLIKDVLTVLLTDILNSRGKWNQDLGSLSYHFGEVFVFNTFNEWIH